ncbi:MAG: VOC family protein [Melioribacteraceae bacterium]
MKLNQIEIILYVADQQRSTEYYSQLFLIKPSLNVSGMTEFDLCNNTKLGLMLEDGIAKILTPKLPHPNEASGIPRCELYIKIDNPKEYFDRAIQLGGKLVSDIKKRDWGDEVGYISDLDGHILAFAKSK